jgi:hypothetical protein
MTATLREPFVPKATLQTTNASATAKDLVDFSAPVFCEAINNQGVFARVYVLARKNSTGETAGTVIDGLLKRLAGTLTFIAASTPTLLNSDLAIAAVTLQGSGNKLQALVTGIAATTINWTFHTHLWTD